MSELIKQNYNLACITPSDINEHFSAIIEYGKKCNHITEMGVRGIISTWGWLATNPKKLVAYDIQRPEQWGGSLQDVEDTAKHIGTEFEFVLANVLDVDIEETDLLFIDTWHKYGQLKEELRLHKNKVRKYLVFHDTESYEFKDEPDWGGLYKDIKPLSTDKKGIWPAIQELLDEGNWEIEERFKNNNGLTILKRKK
jgi:hypothetical protein